MDGQYIYQWQANDSTQSFHFTVPAHSMIGSVDLAFRSDFSHPIYGPVAYTSFMSVKKGSGATKSFEIPTTVFAENDVAEVEGALVANLCNAGANITLFLWPSV